MTRNLADGVAVSFVSVANAVVPLIAAARCIEQPIQRRAVGEAFASGNFDLGGELFDDRRYPRDERCASEYPPARDRPLDSLIVYAGRFDESSIVVLCVRATAGIEATEYLVSRQEGIRRLDPGHGAMMAPRPCLRRGNEAGPDGIERDVPRHLQ
jgi:hypothetical protein